MKVGVIGSKSSCEVVKKSIKEIDSSVEVASYEEEQVNRSDRLIEECEQECDAVLFTGCDRKFCGEKLSFHQAACVGGKIGNQHCGSISADAEK